MDNKVLIIVCGGTFDKEYSEFDGRMLFGETHVPEILKIARCKLPTEMEIAMLIDSLEMTEEQRHEIAKAVSQADTDKIVITHGTDTMAQTARVVGETVKDKTVVFTGAMIPFTFGQSSDGFFNLGAALAFAQSLPHGVYIAMNGRYFNFDNVQKNKTTGVFEELS